MCEEQLRDGVEPLARERGEGPLLLVEGEHGRAELVAAAEQCALACPAARLGQPSHAAGAPSLCARPVQSTATKQLSSSASATSTWPRMEAALSRVLTCVGLGLGFGFGFGLGFGFEFGFGFGLG